MSCYSIYTQNQSKNKIVSGAGGFVGSLTCYYNDDRPGQNIALSALEEMWYGHEENIDHPEGSEYPVSINVHHMEVMRDRVADSVLNRTGIDIRDFDSIIHATTSPGRDKQGNIIEHGNENIIRNV